MKLKKKDNVMVMAGRDRGKTGEVTRVLPAIDQVVVEGVNIVKRHTKPSNKHPRGGILEITKPLPAGKVALICPSCKKPTRIGYQVGKTKERICKKCKDVVK
jgi:large subunit ribosomal protein L24